MSKSSVDDNLLFGLLALQNGLLTRDQLVSAFSVWVVNKSRALDEILVEQQALSSERQAQMQQMVAWHIQMHGQNAEQSLAAVSSASSACRALLSLQDSDIQASLQHLHNSVPPADPFATQIDPTRPTKGTGMRYLTLRPHAKGGLGEVSVAVDSELNREVALKEIQARFADHTESRERFVLEAEITGGLEHPGIVPVYGLGTYPDGRPFYAMRFIKGDSLKDSLEQFHKPEVKAKTPPGERQLQLRKLLGRFIDVCNAIEYAHSRGVLHRDLKPGNIMLGKYGETLVVDWGLAKVVGKEEISTEEATLKPASPLSNSAMTLAGSAVGTPAFMSPEQASGRLDLIGPRSDVYSLGATLFQILSGRVPFEGRDAGEVLRKVQTGNFPRPKQIDRTIPTPLEAICLKSMCLRRDGRYNSAAEIANDIEHWLADERIVAYREGPLEYCERLNRKHPGWVFVAIGICAIMSQTWTHSSEKTDFAKDRIVHQKVAEQLRHARFSLAAAGDAELRGDWDEAISMLSNADQNSPVERRLMARALMKASSYQKVVELLLKGHDQNPHSDWEEFTAAIALKKLDRVQDALHHFSEGVRMAEQRRHKQSDPDSETARLWTEAAQLLAGDSH